MLRRAPEALWLFTLLACACKGRDDGLPLPQAVRHAYELETRDRSGAPGTNYWQIWPRYDLTARLDPASATVHGSGTLSFVNSSSGALEEIVLRLDQNRFTESGRDSPTTRGIAIRRLEINGQYMDLGGPAIHGLGTTVVRLRLKTELREGESLKVYSEWDYEVPLSQPNQALRQGRKGTSVFQIAQWYPRLAMYDDLGGWDVAPHDGRKEFFNPFATFRVQLTVPTGWLVGATGTLSNPQEVLSPVALARFNVLDAEDTVLFLVTAAERGTATAMGHDGLVRWTFDADSVSDFAWGASREYAWATASRKLTTGRLRVHGLMTPPNDESLLRSTRLATDLISTLSTRLMPYPWRDHTLLDGPETGMEYPGLTMTDGDGRLPHEIAHQWFPMMVGSDETRFDFLDEGFATFYSGLASGGTVPAARVERAALMPLLDPLDIRTARATLGYGRGSRMLNALAAQVGDDHLMQALRSYALTWRFKHPSPWDFMASMETSLNRKLDTFWLQWLFSADEIVPIK